MIKFIQTQLCYAAMLAFLMLSASCVSTKKISYLNDIPDSNYITPYELSLEKYTDPVIQPNDILQVSIQTLDPQASTLMGVQATSTYSVQSGTSLAGGTTTAIQGYMVDGEGYISIPLVGKLQVNGLNTTQVKQLIEQRAALYYKNPVVNVRFVNFTVTVLGEVNRTGQIVLSNEKTSIFDVLGAAGDMTPYARRQDVLVIREEGGIKKFIRLNLYSKDVFQSPYFYMKQRDVVYVEPNKSKAVSANTTETRVLSFTGVFISILTLVLYISRK